MMVSTTTMEKQGQELQQQQQQQQQALKCPRCDSSNTKFCYYNNYSLSQPRHFCKACKRYWTRGGTLRNVPVGGGCRKNKRVKRPNNSNNNNNTSIDGGASSTSSANPLNPSPSSQAHLDINPLFYGLHTNPNDMNLSFQRFNSSGGGGGGGGGVYDLQPQLNGFGLGFDDANDNDYRNGFKQIQIQIQDHGVTSNSLLSSYSNSIFGSSSSTTNVINSPTMATLLASTFHQRKLINGGAKPTQTPNHHNFHSLTPFQDLQISGGDDVKQSVKVEDGQTRMDHHWNNLQCQNQIDNQIGLSDPSLYWNATSLGTWHDPSNIGSSVTSLI